MSANGLPRVAIAGRPNVGKSTLANRLAARKGSIVSAMPGLTRDRVDTEVQWGGRRFILFDTGGVEEPELDNPKSTISGKVAQHALAAAKSADVVLFVVDATTGLASDDLALGKRLRKLDIPILVIANKVDDAVAESAVPEFWRLGLGEPIGVSGLHGRGTGELLDSIVTLLPESTAFKREIDIPSIALVGRPNVGKSSLFNSFAGEERSIVHHEPGTTRDSIDSIVTVEGRDYRFIDTAGLKRRAKTRGPAVPSSGRTRSSIERADLAILVVDAAEGPTVQDQRIARQVSEEGVGAVLALNKWDLVQGSDEADMVEESVRDRLHFVSYAPMVRTSALTKRAVSKLLATIDPVLKSRNIRIPTATLNQILIKAQQSVPPPRRRNRSVKIFYATQVEVAPPTVVLFASGELGTSWLRYFERRLREEFGFEGNPIRIKVRERTRGSDDG